MSSKKNLTELQAEIDQLKDPTDRPPANTPRAGMQVVDRQRLLAAWESNVKTLRGVLEQMAFLQNTNMLTRVISLLTLLCNLILMLYMMSQLSKMAEMVGHLEQSVNGRRSYDQPIVQEPAAKP